MNKLEMLGKMAFENHRIEEGLSAGTLPPMKWGELGKKLIRQHKLEHKILYELRKVM
jgi:hypothetical protein